MCITKLLQGDCLELMKKIPNNSVDMILCDLPYGTTRNKWDVIIPFEALWERYNHIIKKNGVIALFCDGLFMAELMQSNKKMWRYNLIWDKQRGSDFLNANVKPLKCHEEISIFYKKKPTYNKQLWYSTPYKLTKNGNLSDNYGNRKTAYTESLNGARNPLSILSYSKNGSRLHPTQKPVELCEYLIKTYTNENGVVLDNFMGSGTTGVACVNTNRNFIGMELDENYFNIAKDRIEKAKEGEICQDYQKNN